MKVIVFYIGQNVFLDLCLRQACRFHGKENTILLGDHLPESLKDDCTFVSVRDYWKSAGRLEENFEGQHLGGTDFAKIVMQRWVCVADYVEQQGIEQFIVIDADVLLYENMKYMEQVYREYDIAAVEGSLHTTYFNGLEGIRELRDYFIHAYESEEMKMRRDQEYDRILTSDRQRGGVCDMTLFTWFSMEKSTCSKIANVHSKYGAGPCGYRYDSSMGRTDRYLQSFAGLKQVKMIDGKAYCYDLQEEKWCPFASLHFLGKKSVKRWMYEYYSGRGAWKQRWFGRGLRYKVDKIWRW